jgi:seryl-tRNA synthetase
VISVIFFFASRGGRMDMSFEKLLELYRQLNAEYKTPIEKLFPKECEELETLRRELKSLGERISALEKEYEKTLRCNVCGSAVVRVPDSAPVYSENYLVPDFYIDTSYFMCERYRHALEVYNYYHHRITDEDLACIREHRGARVVGDQKLAEELQNLQRRYDALRERKWEIEEELAKKYEQRRMTILQRIREIAKKIERIISENPALVEKIDDDTYRKLLIDSI